MGRPGVQQPMISSETSAASPLLERPAERLERITSSSSPGYFIFPEPVLGQPSALVRRRSTELLGGLAARARLVAL